MFECVYLIISVLWCRDAGMVFCQRKRFLLAYSSHILSSSHIAVVGWHFSQNYVYAQQIMLSSIQNAIDINLWAKYIVQLAVFMCMVVALKQHIDWAFCATGIDVCSLSVLGHVSILYMPFPLLRRLYKYITYCDLVDIQSVNNRYL